MRALAGLTSLSRRRPSRQLRTAAVEAHGRETHLIDRPPYRITLSVAPTLSATDIETIVAQMAHQHEGPSIWHETRGVLLPCDSRQTYDGIKIKGAGYCGQPVRFGVSHNAVYSLPRYDFEGNYTPDAAKDFHRPHSGGMSYQQALHEVRVAALLCENGVATYPPLGYGTIALEDEVSWFCLLNVPYRPERAWKYIVRKRVRMLKTVRRLARSQRRLKDLGVFLALWGAAIVDGRFLRKDFHSVHLAGPNDSFMTRLCYYLFDANFILYTINHPYWVSLAEADPAEAGVAFVEELSGIPCDAGDVARFRALARSLKENDSLGIDERMSLVAADPVGAALLDQFASEEDRLYFFKRLGDGEHGWTEPPMVGMDRPS